MKILEPLNIPLVEFFTSRADMQTAFTSIISTDFPNRYSQCVDFYRLCVLIVKILT